MPNANSSKPDFHLNQEEKEIVIRWMGLCKWQIPLIEETQSNWREWVVEPVIKRKIAAREARAVLEVIGVYVDKGVEVFDLLARLLENSSDHLEKQNVIQKGKI